MADVQEIKARLILAAYTGAVAVCEPLIANPDGTQVKLDPLIQDVGLQNKGVLVYEEAKVQYAALLRAFQDKTGIWPDPQLPAGSAQTPAQQPAPTSTAQVVTLVQSIFKGLPSTIASPAAQQLVGLLGALVSSPSPTQPATPSAPTSAPASIPSP